MAGHARSAFQVEQVEQLAQLHVVPHRKIELRHRRLTMTHYPVGRSVLAHGGIGMGHVGHLGQQGQGFLLHLLQLLLHLVALLTQAAALFLEFLAFFRRRFTDRAGDFVGLAIELLELAVQFASFLFQLDEPVQVHLHVAAAAVLSYRFQVFQHELTVEHRRGIPCTGEFPNRSLFRRSVLRHQSPAL